MNFIVDADCVHEKKCYLSDIKERKGRKELEVKKSIFLAVVAVMAFNALVSAVTGSSIGMLAAVVVLLSMVGR